MLQLCGSDSESWMQDQLRQRGRLGASLRSLSRAEAGKRSRAPCLEAHRGRRLTSRRELPDSSSEAASRWVLVNVEKGVGCPRPRGYQEEYQKKETDMV